MPNTREKLIELLHNFYLDYNGYICDGCGTQVAEQVCGTIADHLIANGVTISKMETVAKDNNVPSKWIPVTERLPEHGEVVLVFGSRGGVYTAVFNKPGQYRGWHKLNSKSHYCDPTHWMPLPQPPKGE